MEILPTGALCTDSMNTHRDKTGDVLAGKEDVGCLVLALVCSPPEACGKATSQELPSGPLSHCKGAFSRASY